ncbi:PAS domain-containing protein [Rhizobiaceae bacterium CRRU44]|uniref:histidine kinase n=1 Tax=Ferranicluibacter rubi TaxID=2715133 RepID=A0AA43ZIE5_9HYPH|nr:PAS domain-containing protein [Ferranicluibacter rubi]
MTRDEPDWGPEHLRGAIEAAGVALWSWEVDTDVFVMDGHGYRLWDVGREGTLTFEHLSEKIHPADRDRVRAAFRATRAVKGPYETDFRIIVGSNIRWISARGQGHDEGIVGRTMTGVFLDVAGRKQAEEGHELLAGEMSHRVKNLLAVAAGLTKITSRSSTSVDDMTDQLTRRLIALGRAHDLVRPLADGQGNAALLGDLFTVLLAPYDSTAAFSGLIRVAVPRMGVGENAANGLALVIHELATNSLKYGALSSPEGTLDVFGTVVGQDVEILWSEQGGPDVVPPAEVVGYGSQLVRRTMQGTLGGSISFEWPRSGVQVTVRIREDRLAL